jgi:aryl sulfotransferase
MAPSDLRERCRHEQDLAPQLEMRLDRRTAAEMLIRPPEREYRTWIFDSRRWQHYRPRRDDIVIATYPKCGTTWMQQIVGLLIFQTPEPKPIMQVSAWIDRRFPQPIEAVIAQIEAQEHRRFLKSHMPLDALPFYDEVKYIHVARDGRDASMSFHNHAAGFTVQMLAGLDRAGLEDEAVGRPYPEILADPAEFFHRWITRGEVPGHEDGSPSMSFFELERSWWAARKYPNVLLVHYNDLKKDLRREMQRIAEFLDIAVAPALWPELVEAAGFEAMRRAGATLMSTVASIFKEGSERFFFQGTNERWRGVVRAEDLARYDAKAKALLPPACARWTAEGRRHQ